MLEQYLSTRHSSLLAGSVQGSGARIIPDLGTRQQDKTQLEEEEDEEEEEMRRRKG